MVFAEGPRVLAFLVLGGLEVRVMALRGALLRVLPKRMELRVHVAHGERSGIAVETHRMEDKEKVR